MKKMKKQFPVRVVVYDNFHVSNNCIGSKY